MPYGILRTHDYLITLVFYNMLLLYMKS